MMKRILHGIIALCLLGAVPASLAADLTGMWRLEDKPVWVEIAFAGGVGTGTIARNDDKPESVGFALMTDLTRETVEEGVWQGQIYAEALKEHKDATFTATTNDELTVKVKVGFLRRTVKWQRAESLPE